MDADCFFAGWLAAGDDFQAVRREGETRQVGRPGCNRVGDE